MNFNFTVFISLLVYFYNLIVFEGDYIPLNPKKSYLDFNLEKGPVHLEFSKANNFKGKSENELNETGHFVDEDFSYFLIGYQIVRGGA